MLIFVEGGKPETTNSTHMTLSPEIELELTVVRGELLAATPPMLPMLQCSHSDYYKAHLYNYGTYVSLSCTCYGTL
jgi:hypothetical protein